MARIETLVAGTRRGPALDRSVSDDRNASRHGLPLPPGLELQWLGTAGFRLTHGRTTLLIDPFVTRRDLRSTVLGGALLPDPAVVERLLPRADAVLVGHCHFDHALDVAPLAAAGARVYGSRSAVNLCALHGLGDRAEEVVAHRPYEIGPFTVRFVPSLHSKLIAGLAVNSSGELTCDALDRLGANAYRCGQVWGLHIEVDGFTIYHQGSANLIEEEYRYGAVDLFLSGIAGRLYTPRFTARVLRTVQPAVVVPHHHDDFFRPLDAPMGFSFNVNLAGFVDDVDRLGGGAALRTLDPFQSISG